MTDVNNQHRPAISKNIVVWLDWRNGNADIYGIDLNVFHYNAVPTVFESAKLIQPLASYRILQAESLLETIQEPCTKLKDENDPLYGKCCADRLDKPLKYLEMAKEFFSASNYIAANYWALKALDLLQEIEECTK
ncbi:MAG: hypothetical protein PVF58_12180 [Candidatus Methanofastidiosia archaeon]